LGALKKKFKVSDEAALLDKLTDAAIYNSLIL
jgi:hypothetical protein